MHTAAYKDQYFFDGIELMRRVWTEWRARVAKAKAAETQKAIALKAMAYRTLYGVLSCNSVNARVHSEYTL